MTEGYVYSLHNRFNIANFKRLDESRLQVFLKNNTWTSKVLLTWIMTEGVLIHCRTVHFQEAEWSRLQVFLKYNTTWTSFLFVNLKPINHNTLMTKIEHEQTTIWTFATTLLGVILTSFNYFFTSFRKKYWLVWLFLNIRSGVMSFGHPLGLGWLFKLW